PKRLLIDTHVWLWWNANDLRLGKGARLLLQRASEVHFSAASAWEIAIKVSIGKLTLPNNADISAELVRDGFRELPVTIGHAEEMRRLPVLHRDPFDRLIIAQARVEGLALLTADAQLSVYGVATMDARV
ncbi:MAG: type II toxin-antitoxin system VapC family toxin, partial [Gemmatimonadaceae bacterium]